MTVSTFIQPDSSSQVGADYKAAIDGAIHIHNRIGGAFACHQNNEGSPGDPDMTVRVDAGSLVRAGIVPLEVAAQSTGTLTAPVSNPRKDIVYIDNTTGTVGVATGDEAGSPTDPAIPAGKTAVARVSLFVGMTEITNADIDDLRVGGSAPEFTAPDLDSSPQTDGTAGLVPAPQIADAGKYLRTDGWAAPAANEVSFDPGSPPSLSASNLQEAIEQILATLTPAFTKYYDSGGIGFSSGLSVGPLPHGLGGKAKIISVFLRCLNAASGYSVGDEVPINPMTNTSSSNTNQGVSIINGTSGFTLKFGSATNVFLIIDASTGNTASQTNTNWELVIRAAR